MCVRERERQRERERESLARTVVHMFVCCVLLPVISISFFRSGKTVLDLCHEVGGGE